MIVVTGTLAYDTIGRHGSTRDPRNVKLDALAAGFGGCAGNVAYALRLLDRVAVPVAAAGLADWGEYREHLRDLEIDESGIVVVPGARCARGFVFTAPDGGQFTAFHPGPVAPDLLRQRLVALLAAFEPAALVIAPDQAEVLETITPVAAAWRKALASRRIVWCPGQYAGHLPASLTRSITECADLVILSRHEYDHLGVAAGASRTTLVLTDGADPVEVAEHGRSACSVPVPPATAVDPTGCGDAFTAGFVDAWLAGAAAPDCARAGIRVAAACLAHAGAQGYRLGG